MTDPFDEMLEEMKRKEGEKARLKGRLEGRREGRLEGKREERLDAIQNMMDLGLTKEQILRKYSLEEYEAALRSMPAKV